MQLIHRRKFGARCFAFHDARLSADQRGVESVFDVGGVVGLAPDVLGVGFIFGKKQLLRCFKVKMKGAQRFVGER